MALKILNPSGDQLVGVGYVVMGYGWEGSNCPLGPVDPYGGIFSGCALDLGYASCKALFGYAPGDSAPIEVNRFKPDARPYTGLHDWTRYGSILQNWATIRLIAQGASVRPVDVPSRERELIHPSSHGEVSVSHVPYVPFAARNSFIGNAGHHGYEWCTGFLGWDTSFTTGGLYLRGYQSILRYTPLQGSASEFSIVPYPGEYNSHAQIYADLDEVLEDIEIGRYGGVNHQRGFRWTYLIGVNRPVRTQPTSFEVIRIPQDGREAVQLVYAFDVTVKMPNDQSFTTGFVTTYTIGDFAYERDLTSQPNSIVELDTRSMFSVREHVHTVCVSTNNPDWSSQAWGQLGLPGGEATSVLTTMDRSILTSEVTPALESVSSLDVINIEKRLSPLPFEAAVLASLNDIRPTTYLSGVDAMSSIESDLESNLIEQMVGFLGVAEYLPRLSDVLALIRSAAKKDLIGSAGQLMDLITELRLRQAFTYSPDLDFFSATVPELYSRLTTFLSQPVGQRIGYGSFEYQFPSGEFGYENVRLVTRTKVVCDAGLNSDIRTLLGLDSLGVLPLPGNLWDLVPFSFVIDWFLKIGDRIRAAEKSLLLASMSPQYFVHTFKVTAVIDAQSLAMAGVSPIIGSTPTNTVYIREVSRLLPGPRESKYDFLLPSRPPNWLTGGSLAWQVLT